MKAILFLKRSKNSEKKTKFKKHTYHIIDNVGNMGIVLLYKFCIRCIDHIKSSMFPFVEQKMNIVQRVSEQSEALFL